MSDKVAASKTDSFVLCLLISRQLSDDLKTNRPGGPISDHFIRDLKMKTKIRGGDSISNIPIMHFTRRRNTKVQRDLQHNANNVFTISDGNNSPVVSVSSTIIRIK